MGSFRTGLTGTGFCRVVQPHNDRPATVILVHLSLAWIILATVIRSHFSLALVIPTPIMIAWHGFLATSGCPQSGSMLLFVRHVRC